MIRAARLGGLLAVIPAACLAHAFLVSADPAVGTIVPHPPASVRLRFTERVEPSLSAVAVRDAAGLVVSIGPCRADGAADRLVVALKPLPPGRYQVTWHAIATDLHRTEGSFRFRVGP